LFPALHPNFRLAPEFVRGEVNLSGDAHRA